MPQKTTSHGITLIEMLVVIAIVLALAILLLPAIQAARESARLTQCKNNLRQIGFAAAKYENANNCFPIGCIGGPFSSTKNAISCNTQMLPFLEEHELRSSIDLKLPSYHPVNQAARNTVISTFLCPSTSDDTFNSPAGLWKGAAFTDYGGVYGVEGVGRDIEAHDRQVSDDSANSKERRATQTLRDDSLGIMLYESAVRAKQISDGLSKTAVCAEVCLRRISQMTEWANGRNIFSQEEATPINGDGLNNEIGSPHPNGALLAFCDAHVEFVAESIEQAALNAALTKAGGER